MYLKKWRSQARWSVLCIFTVYHFYVKHFANLILCILCTLWQYNKRVRELLFTFLDFMCTFISFAYSIYYESIHESFLCCFRHSILWVFFFVAQHTYILGTQNNYLQKFIHGKHFEQLSKQKNTIPFSLPI